MDVTSLYTNIPNEEGIRAAAKFIRANGTPGQASPRSLLSLLRIVLTCNNFTFNNKHYLQIGGTAMGTKVAPSYAIIFMADLEKRLLNSAPHQPAIYLRYIDDIFILWLEGRKKLDMFIQHMNTSHDTIKFTAEISPTKVSFLDTLVSISDKHTLQFDLFTKPTDTHGYLHYQSAHPTSTKDASPYGQFLRLRRICSNTVDYEKHARDTIAHYENRGYPTNLLIDSYNKALQMERLSLLKPKETKTKNNRIPLITDYHPHSIFLKKIINRHWDLLQTSPKCRDTFTEKPLFGYRRNPMLRDQLVRADFSHPTIKGYQGSSIPNKVEQCQKGNCSFCHRMEKGKTFQSTHTHTRLTYRCHVKTYCSTMNVVYLLTCAVCNKQYVGETKREFQIRIKEHLRDVKKHKDTPVALHFNLPGHDANSIRYRVIEVLRHDPESTEATTPCKDRESDWIHQLHTMDPVGINHADWFINMKYFFAFFTTVALTTLISGQQLRPDVCSVGETYKDVETSGAGAVLMGLFPIHQRSEGSSGCGDVGTRLFQIQSFEAVKFALERINNARRLLPFKLGMRAYDSCSSPAVSIAAVQDYFPWMSSSQSMCTVNSSYFSPGVLGPHFSAPTAAVAHQLTPSKTTHLSYGARTSVLSDKRKYPFFMRSDIPTSATIEATIAILKKVGWERFAILYSEEEYGRNMMDLILKAATAEGLCISTVIGILPSEISSDETIKRHMNKLIDGGVTSVVYAALPDWVTPIMTALEDMRERRFRWLFTFAHTDHVYHALTRDSLFIGRKMTSISEFQNYFVSQVPANDDSWFSLWYQARRGCSFPFCSTQPSVIRTYLNSQYEQAEIVEPAIKAVFAYAAALGAVCNGNPSCPALRGLTYEDFYTDYLQKVRFTFDVSDLASLAGQTISFDANGDPESFSGLTVYQLVDVAAATYEEVGVYTSTGLNWLRASLGTFVISACPPPRCLYCIALVDSIRYSYIPPTDTSKPALVIGSLFSVRPYTFMSGIQVCGRVNVERATSALAFHYAMSEAQNRLSYLAGLLIETCNNAPSTSHLLTSFHLGVEPLVDNSGRHMNPASVLAYTDDFSSKDTLSLAPVTTTLGIPQVGTRAGAAELRNTDNFPFYTSVAVVDSAQIRAMSYFLAKNKLNFVQVVYVDDYYGNRMLELFRDTASQVPLCIGATHRLHVNPADTDYNDTIKSLRQRLEANIVLVFAPAEHMSGLFKAIDESSVAGTFQLLSSVNWMTDPTIVAGLTPEAISGSYYIDFTIQAIPGYTEFNQFLQGLDVTNNKDIPFLSELYESVFNCSLDINSHGFYSQPCDTASQKLSTSSLSDSPYNKFVMASVHAISSILNDMCSGSDVCENVYDVTEFRSRLQDRLSQWDENLDVTYHITMYSTTGQIPVASYHVPTDIITLSGPPVAPTQCSGLCPECLYLHKYHPYHYDDGDIIIGGLVGFFNTLPNNPLLCRREKLMDSYQHVAAIKYALNDINSNNNTLNNVKLGSLILDACDGGSKTFTLLSGIYSGIFQPKTLNMPLMMNDVRAWLTFALDSTSVAAEFLGNLGLPVVSPYSSNVALRDREKYPTFFSTVPGEDKLSLALAQVLQRLGLSYVQVVYSGDEYGRSITSTFAWTLAEYGACMVKSYEIIPGKEADLAAQLVANPSQVVVILSDKEALVKGLLKQLNSTQAGRRLMLVTDRPWQSILQDQATMMSTPILSLQISDNVPAFQNYISANAANLDDDQFYKFYVQMFLQCNMQHGGSRYAQDCTNLDITQSNSFFQDPNVVSTINAVHVLARAIHQTLVLKCGSSYSGVCKEFVTDSDTNEKILKYLSQVSFDDPNGRRVSFPNGEGESRYDILQFNARGSRLYRKVGEYENKVLSFDSTINIDQFYENTVSVCRDPCVECLQKVFKFTHVPGTLYIGGLFDVHYRSIYPFTCGQVKTLHGIQLLEAFNFALASVKNKFPSILNGVTLGGIGLDGCESGIRTGYLVSNIHNGKTQLIKQGQEIEAENIVAYVGTYESGRTAHLARILKELKIPQVSYSATSSDLNNEWRYPYFLRTVPSDDRQSKVIVEFLTEHSIQYVQVVYSSTSYGRRGTAAFSSLARANQICVAQTVEFADNGTVSTASANGVVTQLLSKPLASVVIVFADTDYINPFLLAVKRSSVAHGKFRFIGTISWGDESVVLENILDEAIGSVTLTPEYVESSAFNSYLNKNLVLMSERNPWFIELYEAVHQCHLVAPNTGRFVYGRLCGVEPDLTVTSGFTQDPGVLHTMNAVYATALGIDYALKILCGDNYHGVCEQFRTSDNRGELIFQGIHNASFTDESNQQFAFTADRDSTKGYHLYALTSTRGTLKYEMIGDYKNDVLSFVNHYDKDAETASWNAACNREGVCSECPAVVDHVTRLFQWPAATRDDETDDRITYLVGVFNIHPMSGLNAYHCGKMDDVVGIQNALAFKYAISLVNQQTNRFSLKFRGIILDACSNSIRVDSDLYALISGQGYCNVRRQGLGSVDLSTLSAVVCTGDENVMAANRILSPLSVTVVSPDVTAPRFGNHDIYTHLMRTLPPYDLTAQIYLAILKDRGWKYVSMLYSDGDEGTAGSNALIRLSQGSEICVGFARSLASDDNVTLALRELDNQANRGARVVVLFTTPEHTKLLKAALLATELQNSLVFVGGSNMYSSLPVADIPGNTIVLQLSDGEPQNFKTYLEGIASNNDLGLPQDWFEEFYEQVRNSQMELNRDVLYTIIATYTTAMGTDAAFKTVCGTRSYVNCMEESGELFRREILQKTLSTNWITINTTLGLPDNVNSLKTFTYKTPERYGDINVLIHLVQNGKETKVGTWSQNSLSLDGEALVWGTALVSLCAVVEGCTCLEPAGSGRTLGQRADDPWASLKDWPRNYFHYTSSDFQDGTKSFEWPVWALVVAILTSALILITLMLFMMLLVCYPNKYGTTVLGFLLMVGIFTIFAVNFAFFVQASSITCGIRRFVLGLAYAICFAALLVKAVDNWRHEYDDYDEYVKQRQYKGITNSCCLLLIALFLICVQLIIPIIWLLLVPPTATLMVPTALRHDYWWCNPPGFYDVALVLSLVYVLVLMLLTVIFSAMSWKNPNNKHESRWILGASVSVAGVTMVWMVVSILASPPNRDAAVTIGNFVAATLLLICIPLRKTFLLFLSTKSSTASELSQKEESPYGEVVHEQRPYLTKQYQNPTFDHMGDYGYDVGMDNKRSADSSLHLHDDGMGAASMYSRGGTAVHGGQLATSDRTGELKIHTSTHNLAVQSDDDSDSVVRMRHLRGRHDLDGPDGGSLHERTTYHHHEEQEFGELAVHQIILDENEQLTSTVPHDHHNQGPIPRIVTELVPDNDEVTTLSTSVGRPFFAEQEIGTPSESDNERQVVHPDAFKSVELMFCKSELYRMASGAASSDGSVTLRGEEKTVEELTINHEAPMEMHPSLSSSQANNPDSDSSSFSSSSAKTQSTVRRNTHSKSDLATGNVVPYNPEPVPDYGSDHGPGTRESTSERQSYRRHMSQLYPQSPQ